MGLKEAIGKDVFIIDDDSYSDNTLEAMSLDDLESLKIRINSKIGNLSTLIKAKKIEYQSGGKGATSEWYKRHRYALSINQQALAYINSLVKKLRRTERHVSDYFMDQAKRSLSTKDYERILGNALNEKEMKEGKL